MFDVATAAVEGALAAGARYADARVMVTRTEGMAARNGVIESLRQDEAAGVGVRALLGASWGFFATPVLTPAAARAAGEEAAAVARASALVPGPAVDLGGAAPIEDRWTSTWREHPLDDVTLSEKGDLLVAATQAINDGGVGLADASYRVWDTEKWFVSSEGHRISQHVVECGAAMSATAIGDSETQRRSYPGIRGQYGTSGWELVRESDLLGNAPRIADEALALLRAPSCPAGTTDLILGSEQLALQIHESVGHAVELDRILGWEAAYAGTSWLDLAQLGSMRFGSPLMNITADATLPGALGSFGYDDEGTPARSVDIVREGVWVGVLSGRDSAAVAGLGDSGGMVRADGYNRLPMVRMTNVGLIPGESSLEEIVAATDDGILMDTNRSWSIDDKRLNFQFGCEIGWEIKNGRRVRMVRNPTYTGISPTFWGSMDMIGNESEWVFWGTPNCGKGQPTQIGHTGHPAVPARFRNVRVGVRG
ncbi:MAG TPA: TldD/PmbA family protein [Acidimicrobiales bacterium]|nr:TldD/PmbA family protein [Acidimicrobiales bacterium]